MKCSYCKKQLVPKFNIKKDYRRRFCGMAHYHAFRKEMRPVNEHECWQGGVSNTEAHRRWKAKNPERMSHLKSLRYARERGAKGSHTLQEWNELKAKHGYSCIGCRGKYPLTKDHIVPLSEGGSNYISNIQPLCRRCNSRKWKKPNIYENPSLLSA